MSDTHQAIDTVWRQESARVIAGVARMVNDVGRAEELAQDALVAALEQWPRDGVPNNPGAWLMATAKRRAIDHIRREQVLARKVQELGHEIETGGGAITEPDIDAALDDDIGDDVLRLVFTACHPVLTTEARVALTLRMLGGLSTRRSPAPTWSAKPPSSSGSCVPNAPSPMPRSPSRYPPRPNGPRGSHPCSK
ncbi:hypothetical protein GCM10029964_058950 [Kibdelosporangium lantanae]